MYGANNSDNPIKISIPIKSFAIVGTTMNGWSGGSVYLLTSGSKPSESKVTQLANNAYGVDCKFDTELNIYTISGLNQYSSVILLCVGNCSISQS